MDSPVPPPPDPGAKQLWGIWGSSATNVFAVGYWGPAQGNTSQYIFHYDGSSWSKMTSFVGDWNNVILYSIWGSSASDVFAVGKVYHMGGDDTKKCIVHYDGTSWSRMIGGELDVMSANNKLFDIWGSAPTDVFAVGEQGTILHYDGSVWSQMTSATTATLSGIWGSSSDNILVVGSSGTILDYDGDSWLPMTIGITPNLLGIWGDSATDVFAVGEGGTILKFETSERPRSLTIAVNGSGTTTPVAGSHNYFDDTLVNITAVPDPGWHFVDWTGDVDTIEDVNEADTQITMDESYSIVANFAINTYTITTSSGIGGNISTIAKHGDTPTFSFSPNASYNLEDVLIDGNSVGAISSYTFAPIDSNHTIAVNFTHMNHPPVIQSVTANPVHLWPANGKPVNVTINVISSDPDGNSDIALTTYSVSDEYGEYNVAETNLPSDGVISLMSERDSKDKDGRVYTITVKVYDIAGLFDTGTCNVVVGQ